MRKESHFTDPNKVTLCSNHAAVPSSPLHLGHRVLVTAVYLSGRVSRRELFSSCLELDQLLSDLREGIHILFTFIIFNPISL